MEGDEWPNDPTLVDALSNTIQRFAGGRQAISQDAFGGEMGSQDGFTDQADAYYRDASLLSGTIVSLPPGTRYTEMNVSTAPVGYYTNVAYPWTPPPSTIHEAQQRFISAALGIPAPPPYPRSEPPEPRHPWMISGMRDGGLGNGWAVTRKAKGRGEEGGSERSEAPL